MRAVRYNQLEIAEVLLNSGADANYVPYEDSYYPIYYAVQYGSSELIYLLLKHGAFLDKVRPTIGTPSQIITPLHIAAQYGNYDAVVTLISAGAKINIKANITEVINAWKDGNPLDYAAFNLTYKDNPRNLDLVKFLVDHGAIRRYYGHVGCPVINGYLKGVGR